MKLKILIRLCTLLEKCCDKKNMKYCQFCLYLFHQEKKANLTCEEGSGLVDDLSDVTLEVLKEMNKKFPVGVSEDRNLGV